MKSIKFLGNWRVRGLVVGLTVTSISMAVAEDLTGFDCSQIAAQAIDKQANTRAALIRMQCGLEAPAGPSGTQAAVTTGGSLSSLVTALGGTDVQTNADPGAYPHVVQAGSMVWANATTIVVGFNDSSSAPSCYGGITYSTDGGATFVTTNQGQLCSGHGTNYGDPLVVYDAAAATWFAGNLASGCGGQGIGVWTSADGQTFAAGACAHNGGSDDRPSMWVDNAPASPFYGRLYISYNDFNVGGGALYVTHSSDNGATWAPVQVKATFIRDVQLTGSPNGDGAVFLAAMDEGGGGAANRTNYMFRSTDGGVTWSAPMAMGAAFAPPGDANCPTNSYFRMVSPLWRYMGWGQAGVGPSNVVHYVYAGAGSGGDTGDILYVRSTDNGTTWSAPLKLNTDATTRPQWMPQLAVTPSGGLLAAWYDRRETLTDDYRWYGRVSLDNGATWQADQPISDIIIPQPLQPDPAVLSCYGGDYNYHSAFGNTAYTTWTDGRVAISGHQQMDVFFDQVDLSLSTPTPTPTATPTATETPTETPTPTPKEPIITGGASAGSTTVTGSSVPNATPNNNCIEIFSCGADGVCGDTGDQSLGTGSVDASGRFTVTVSPPLSVGEKIYAVDTCHHGLMGPVFIASPPSAAPLMSPATLLMLIATLGVVGLLGLSRVRQR